jgi:hypothetical protein
VVSLSNHERLHRPAFDKLRPNGLYQITCGTPHYQAPPLDPSGDFMPVGIAGWIERMGSKPGGTYGR